MDKDYHNRESRGYITFYIICQGGRIFGAGKDCPLSFDRSTNLDGDDLRKQCGTSYSQTGKWRLPDDASCIEPPSYGDLWDAPSKCQQSNDDCGGNMSVCAGVAAPGFILGLIVLVGVLLTLPPAKQLLASKIRENQHQQAMLGHTHALAGLMPGVTSTFETGHT